jgi:hypothetical protein
MNIRQETHNIYPRRTQVAKNLSLAKTDVDRITDGIANPKLRDIYQSPTVFKKNLLFYSSFSRLNTNW